MTRASKVFAIKWFVVPCLCAVVGYFGIGPILSGRTEPTKVEVETQPADPPRRFTSEPEVEVSATPATRRRSAPEPAPTPAPERSRVRVVEPPMPDSQLPDDATPPPIPEPVDDHSTVPPITTTTGGDDGTEDPPPNHP